MRSQADLKIFGTWINSFKATSEGKIFDLIYAPMSQYSSQKVKVFQALKEKCFLLTTMNSSSKGEKKQFKLFPFSFHPHSLLNGLLTLGNSVLIFVCVAEKKLLWYIAQVF